MITVSFLPFSEPRRDRCRFCNQRITLAYLVLFTENDQVACEMEVCQKCYIMLTEVTGSNSGRGEREEDMFREEV